MAKPPMIEVEIGRDAETGEFISVAEAKRRKKTAIVEKIKRPAPKPAPRKKK